MPVALHFLAALCGSNPDQMKYKDLRDFVGRLETLGELRRIPQNVSPILEMTELCDRVLRAGGPALLFESKQSHAFPVLGNLFGTPRRVALGMGIDSGEQNGDSTALESLRDVGRLLSALKEPEPPKGLRDAGKLLSLAKAVWDMAPKTVSSPPCQEIVWEGADVDLAKLPIQTCWPGDAGPLITWGLTVTRGPNKSRQNLGIYRQQLIGRNKLIMRWLAHRGGALDFREFALARREWSGRSREPRLFRYTEIRQAVCSRSSPSRKKFSISRASGAR